MIKKLSQTPPTTGVTGVGEYIERGVELGKSIISCKEAVFEVQVPKHEALEKGWWMAESIVVAVKRVMTVEPRVGR